MPELITMHLTQREAAFVAACVRFASGIGTAGMVPGLILLLNYHSLYTEVELITLMEKVGLLIKQVPEDFI